MIRMWLWQMLNRLRVRMVEHRIPARTINRISALCVKLYKEDIR